MSADTRDETPAPDAALHDLAWILEHAQPEPVCFHDGAERITLHIRTDFRDRILEALARRLAASAPPAGAVEDAAQLRAFADRIDLMLDSTGGQVSVAAWRLMAHEMRRRAEGAPKLQAPDEAQLLGECERCGSDAWCVRCDPPSWAGDLILAHRTAQQAFTSDNPPKALFAAIEQDLRRVMTALWGKK